MTPVLRLLVGAVAITLAMGAPAGAQSEVESGVWWQANQGGLAVPPPPVLVDLPDGGLWLNSGPNGDSARSAVRFPVSQGDVAEELLLHIHHDSSTPEPVVALCVSKEAWEPPDERPGPWAERAEPDCDRFSSTGTVDGDVVRFALAGLRTGDVDLVLTRVPDDSESYINVTFKKPSPTDLRTGSAVSSGGFVASPTMAPPSSGGAEASGFGGDAITDRGGDPYRVDGRSLADGSPVELDGVRLGRDAIGSTDTRSTRSIAVPLEVSDEPWDAARWAALIALIPLCAWIAAIGRSWLQRGGRSFTMYRGVPPM